MVTLVVMTPLQGIKIAFYFVLSVLKGQTWSCYNFTIFSYSSAGSLSDLGAYYTWFLKAVAKWLDIALFKAVQRILKAVELDDLSTPVDDMVMFRNLTNLGFEVVFVNRPK